MRLDGVASPANVDQPVELQVAIADLLQDQGNRVTVGRSDGTGPLYYTAHLEAFLPVDSVQALDRGMRIERRYTLASCEDGPQCPSLSQVQAGDEIRVELTLVTPHDRYYVVLNDPYPAGAEPV
ncbi:MAG: hypothetical protein HC837_19270, partial [Chloroflexaceae bacterium]|nr:hypothetical protein [Chloroflexaceae bacterium]